MPVQRLGKKLGSRATRSCAALLLEQVFARSTRLQTRVVYATTPVRPDSIVICLRDVTDWAGFWRLPDRLSE
jgi:hypothetical protein